MAAIITDSDVDHISLIDWKYKWKIEYWDPKKELTFCYSSDHHKWDKCPKTCTLSFQL